MSSLVRTSVQRWFVPGLALLAAACGSLPKATVETQPDGTVRVEALEAQSFKALAIQTYDDASLARAIAEDAGMVYVVGVPAGTVLTLPSKEVLKARVSRQKKAESLYQDGRKKADAGQHEEAVAKYRQSLEYEPDRADVQQALGIALLYSGDLDGSFDLLTAAAASHPEDADLRYAYGLALRQRGDTDAARVEFEAAAAADPSHARAAYELAVTLKDLGRNEEARKAYQHFLFEFPGDPWAEAAQRSLAELNRQ